MPKYEYVISNSSGVKSEGFIFASNIQTAKEKLGKKSKIIISIREIKNGNVKFWEKPHLSFQDKMMFTKHMATMIKVGITITEALGILIDQTGNANNRKMYENILEMVESGQTLANSLKSYGNVFSEIFINIIATGEKSGSLEEALEHLDKQLDKEYELRKKIFSAFIYPAVIVSATLLIMVGIVIFIMPKVTKIFESFDVELPFVTRLLINFNKFLIEQPLFAAAAFAGTIAFFITIFKLKGLKPFWHRIILYMPVFGKLMIFSNLAHFCRSINSLLQSGVSVVEALEISSKMIGNSLYKKVILQAKEKVEKGAGLGDSLEVNKKLFPQLATKTLFIGEKTGSLAVTSERLAELYENEVDRITKNLSVLLEPILLVFMGVLVGGIAMAIILPIYQMPNLLQK